MNIFDTDLDLKAFPELFPTGENGMRDVTRTTNIGTSDFIKSRLLNKHPQFRLNINYLFHCSQVQQHVPQCRSYAPNSMHQRHNLKKFLTEAPEPRWRS